MQTVILSFILLLLMVAGFALRTALGAIISGADRSVTRQIYKNKKVIFRIFQFGGSGGSFISIRSFASIFKTSEFLISSFLTFEFA